VLADNGFKKEGDLRFLSAEVIKELPLSICSRAKLKELAKSFLKFRNAAHFAIWPDPRARKELQMRWVGPGRSKREGKKPVLIYIKRQTRRGITVSSS
jgi:hypothetical protein